MHAPSRTHGRSPSPDGFALDVEAHAAHAAVFARHLERPVVERAIDAGVLFSVSSAMAALLLAIAAACLRKAGVIAARLLPWLIDVVSPDPRAYNQESPAASPSAPKPEGERLQLEPYSGPRSHHASRAFADMVARRQRAKARRKKMTLLLVGVVLGGTVAWLAFRLGAAVLGL